MLNDHLEAMSQAIQAAEGKIDRFIGDAVNAVFFAESPTQATAGAIRAARSMTRAHEKLQQRRREEKLFLYDIGIGLAAGSLLPATLQGRDRRDLSLIGPAIHEAEELEAASKQGRATRIMLSDQVRDLLDNKIPLLEHPSLSCWEIAGIPSEMEDRG